MAAGNYFPKRLLKNVMANKVFKVIKKERAPLIKNKPDSVKCLRTSA